MNSRVAIVLAFAILISQTAFCQAEVMAWSNITGIRVDGQLFEFESSLGVGVLGADGLRQTAKERQQSMFDREGERRTVTTTPEGAFHLPVDCSGLYLDCAAFGDIARGVYAVHIVNSGAERRATLSGIPEGIRELRSFVTDSGRGMEDDGRITVQNGKADFVLDAAGLTTLVARN